LLKSIYFKNQGVFMADDNDDTKKRFSLRQYGRNLRDAGHNTVADSTVRNMMAGVGVIGALEVYFIAKENAEAAAGDFKNIEAAQNIGNEKALKIAEEHGMPLDARTLEIMIDARNNAIAEVIASQTTQHNAIVEANLHPAKAMAVGGIGLPLLIALATSLPGSWVKKQAQQENKSAAKNR
jgi:hypothetical protein